MNDTTCALDNPLYFRNNLLERRQKIIFKKDHKTGDEKLGYDINKAAGKISVLSTGRIYKYEYFTSELKPDNRTSQIYIFLSSQNT